jgi:ABC-type multidrug transport system fused ATPase/permease subunit
MYVEDFTKFIKYYAKGREIKLIGFFILSLIAGGLEFLGIALIYPFILLIIHPKNVIFTKTYINFTSFFKIDDTTMSILILGIIVMGMFIAKNLFMIFSLNLQNKFISNWKLAINKKFMYYYLFSPYKNSLKTAPSEKIYTLTFLINQTLDGFIFRLINFFTNITIVIMILLLLFIKFAFAAFLTCIFIFFTMLFQNKLFKAKVRAISQRFFKISALNNEKIIENINNLKEIKILSAENYFYEKYTTIQNEFTKVFAENNFYASIPPYIIETLAVLALFLLAWLISFQSLNNVSWMIASYAVLVAAIFRIAPALNRIQSALNVMNASQDFVKTMIIEYENIDQDFLKDKIISEISFQKMIQLKNINFSYKKSPVIKDLSLEIKKGEFIGIVGLSGAGKSTLADILMGILPIDSGEILVDDIKLNKENFGTLKRFIGYVPQQINILDGSFKRNVAWGIDEEDINEERVINVLKSAELNDFVMQFPEGINSNTIIGSSGISQGQKQRLAIARALYRNPEILILDEATSSLDVETENQITQMLNSLKREKTIIVIAHRLSTLKNCDRLIYLKSGQLLDTGTFSELSQKYKEFENMIKLSNFHYK